MQIIRKPEASTFQGKAYRGQPCNVPERWQMWMWWHFVTCPCNMDDTEIWKVSLLNGKVFFNKQEVEAEARDSGNLNFNGEHEASSQGKYTERGFSLSPVFAERQTPFGKTDRVCNLMDLRWDCMKFNSHWNSCRSEQPNHHLPSLCVGSRYSCKRNDWWASKGIRQTHIYARPCCSEE